MAMKRIMLFSLVFLGLVFAVSAAASPSAAVNAPKALVSVGVVNLEQELALLGQSGVESTPVTCTLCLTQFNCTGHEGAACADNCTCQVCGGSLGCRRLPPPCNPPGPCPIGPPNVDDDPPPQP
jgi:hypothetical protein